MEAARLTLGSILAAGSLAFGCAGSGNSWEPEPTPEFLAERPQRIFVSEPFEDGDRITAQVFAELRSEMKKRGYELVELRADADAVLSFRIGSVESGRNHITGISSADVAVAGELWGATGTVLWRGDAIGHSQDEDDEEVDIHHGLDDFVVGVVVDQVFDAVLRPDYDEMSALAAEDAARGMLWQFPKRVPREESASPPPAR